MKQVTLTKEQTTFVDLSLTFTPNPLTGDISVIRDDRAIVNSVKNLIMTRPTEVPFQRDIGSTISNLLFDICDRITSDLIESEVRRTIDFSEPRVTIKELNVVPKPDQNAYNLHMTFEIIGYDNLYTIDDILTATR